MSKVLLLSHASLCKEFYNTIQLIMGKMDERVECIPLPYGTNLEKYKEDISFYVQSAGEEGVLILTDLFGGSPFMISTQVYQQFSKDIPIEIVTGMNLPMLVEMMTNLDLPVEELKAIALQHGKEGIVDFTEKLEGNERSND